VEDAQLEKTGDQKAVSLGVKQEAKRGRTKLSGLQLRGEILKKKRSPQTDVAFRVRGVRGSVSGKTDKRRTGAVGGGEKGRPSKKRK